MGWYYSTSTPTLKAVHADILKDTPSLKVLKAATANFGRELYVAFETAAGDRFIGVFRCAVHKRDGVKEGGYKPMDEGMGPVIANCPPSLFKVVPEPSGTHAAAWRARCLANHAAKLANRRKSFAPGDKVFVGGRPFTVRGRYKKTRYVIEAQNGQRFQCFKSRMVLADQGESDQAVSDQAVSDQGEVTPTP